MSMSILDWVILAVVLVWAALSVVWIVGRLKRGKCCGCAGCSRADAGRPGDACAGCASCDGHCAGQCAGCGARTDRPSGS